MELPFQSVDKAAVHYVGCGDPRKSNREELNVTLLSKNLPASVVKNGTLVLNEASGVKSGGLPQGSVYVYVLEGCR